MTSPDNTVITELSNLSRLASNLYNKKTEYFTFFPHLLYTISAFRNYS